MQTSAARQKNAPIADDKVRTDTHTLSLSLFVSLCPSLSLPLYLSLSLYLSISTFSSLSMCLVSPTIHFSFDLYLSRDRLLHPRDHCLRISNPDSLNVARGRTVSASSGLQTQTPTQSRTTSHACYSTRTSTSLDSGSGTRTGPPQSASPSTGRKALNAQQLPFKGLVETPPKKEIQRAFQKACAPNTRPIWC
jgi:hypothetical protein